MVLPGQRLSLQSHKKRAEHWVVVSGLATVTKGDVVVELAENESTFIEIGTIHSLGNYSSVELVLIETQYGTYLGEDDIVRYEDIYGRS